MVAETIDVDKITDIPKLDRYRLNRFQLTSHDLSDRVTSYGIDTEYGSIEVCIICDEQSFFSDTLNEMIDYKNIGYFSWREWQGGNVIESYRYLEESRRCPSVNWNL